MICYFSFGMRTSDEQAFMKTITTITLFLLLVNAHAQTQANRELEAIRARLVQLPLGDVVRPAGRRQHGATLLEEAPTGYDRLHEGVEREIQRTRIGLDAHVAP